MNLHLKACCMIIPSRVLEVSRHPPIRNWLMFANTQELSSFTLQPHSLTKNPQYIPISARYTAV